MTSLVAFALACAAHAGFQVTVTALVYPALGDLSGDVWVGAHARHSRRIVPLVAVLYAALLGTGGWLVATGPDALGWLALVGTGAALVVTATLAAPTHQRLQDHDPTLVRRLLVVDRLRCLAAVVGAACAVGAALTAGA